VSRVLFDVIDLESLDLVSSVKVGKQAGGIAFLENI
jgi:hypothetical protein